MWKPLAEWFGVEPEQMSSVLPNLGNFPPSMILNRTSLMED